MAVSPGGVHSPVRSFRSVGGDPIFFKKSEGAFLTSVEDKKYIDFCMSFGPMILGHRDKDVTAEVHKIIDTAWALGTADPYSLELSEWITSRLPFVEKVRFVSSGTEAVMSALRVARAATGRSKILKFDGCYHGHSDNLLVKSGSGLAGQANSDSAGISPNVIEDTLVCELDNEIQFDEIITRWKDSIAAIIIEPLPANYGLLIQRKEFLQKLQTTAQKIGACFILDEVISGFRIGLKGMTGELNLSPDLVCYGKVIGGGFNVAAYAGKKKYMDLVAPAGPVYQAGTLSANPVAMAAGIATLRKCVDTNVWDHLQNTTTKFVTQANALFKKCGSKFKAIHYGSLFWIYDSSNASDDGNPRNLKQIPSGISDSYKSFFHKMLDQGVYLAPSAYEVNFMSLAHDEKVLANTLNAIENALTKK